MEKSAYEPPSFPPEPTRTQMLGYACFWIFLAAGLYALGAGASYRYHEKRFSDEYAPGATANAAEHIAQDLHYPPRTPPGVWFCASLLALLVARSERHRVTD